MCRLHHEQRNVLILILLLYAYESVDKPRTESAHSLATLPLISFHSKIKTPQTTLVIGSNILKIAEVEAPA